MLTVNQITWVVAVEAAIIQGGNAMEVLYEQRRGELLDVVKSVRGNISKMLEHPRCISSDGRTQSRHHRMVVRNINLCRVRI